MKYVVDMGLFGGVGSGNFAPDANMTRAWAIAQGISDGTMADGNVTREQFVTMLWRLEGEPSVESNASFTDNGNVSGYVQTAVRWSVSKSIVNGYNDGTFRPQGSATRTEVAKMLTVYCVTAEG